MTNLYSYKQLSDQIEYFYSTLHLGKYRFVSTVEEQIPNLATEDSQFPAVFMTPISGLHSQLITQTVRIWVYDRLEKDRSNYLDVMSDTQQILNDLRLWFGPFNKLFTGMIAMTDPQTIPLNNRLMDYCNGWYMDITVEMVGTTFCDLPLDPNAPGPPGQGFPSHPLGFSGFSGFSGTSGFSGLNGAAASSGYSGFSGTNGTIGVDGASGVSGYSGGTGTNGTSGFSGVSGFSGTNGSIGVDGASGYSGVSGYSGYSGVSGFSGTNGSNGAAGTSGVSGYSGISGYSGVSGYSGISGYSGVSGFSGILATTINVTSSATPTLAIGTNLRTIARLTGLAVAVTNFSTNFTSTPTHGNLLSYEITDNGTARALAWGATFVASGTVALPTTTVISTLLRVLFQYNDVTSTWQCIAAV